MKRIWQRLSKRERGLVVLTLFLLLVVLGRYLLVAPFLEIQPQLLEKNLRYVNQKGEIMAALEKDRGELKGLEPSLLAGDTPPVSASDLQQAVQALAAKEGTQVITTRVLNPESMGSFTKIPIQVEISGQIDQVVNLIKGIEAAEKLLVVSELNVRSLFVPAGVARPPAAPQLPPQNLRASLIVSGFTRSQPAPPQKSEPAPTKTKSDEGKTPAKSGPRQ
jgi:hypothetical protein